MAIKKEPMDDDDERKSFALVCVGDDDSSKQIF